MRLVVAVALFATLFVQSVIVNAECFAAQTAQVDLARKGGIEVIFTGKVASVRSDLAMPSIVSLRTVGGTVLQTWSLPAHGQVDCDMEVSTGSYWLVVESDGLAKPLFFEFYW